MARQFERDGIRFQYPDNWQLESKDAEGGWIVSVQSPDTAFLIISFHPDEDDPARLADGTLAVLRKEYPQLEAQTAVETLAGQPAIGHDINFFSLDLTNTCWTRCLRGPYGCVLIMCQCTDEELESQGEVLRAICASLHIDDTAGEAAPPFDNPI